MASLVIDLAVGLLIARDRSSAAAAHLRLGKLAVRTGMTLEETAAKLVEAWEAGRRDQ